LENYCQNIVFNRSWIKSQAQISL